MFGEVFRTFFRRPALLLPLSALFVADGEAAPHVCRNLLGAGPIAGSSIVASGGRSDGAAESILLAWEELLLAGTTAENEASLRAWLQVLLQSRFSSSSRDLLPLPPEGLLPLDVEAGMAQIEALALDLAGRDAQLRARLQAGILESLERFRERDSTRSSAEKVRVPRAFGLRALLTISIGNFVSRMPDLAELADGRRVALGFGSDPQGLVFIDSGKNGSPTNVMPVSASNALHEGGGGIAGAITPLASGGFVVSTMNNILAFYSSAGERLALHELTAWTTGNRSRPAVLRDGTVAFVDQFERLSLFTPEGEFRTAPIRLPGQSHQVHPIALRGGGVGVSAGRIFQVFSSEGEKLAEFESLTELDAQPVELSDGAIIVGGKDGNFAILGQPLPGIHRLSALRYFETGRHLHSATPIELMGGEVVVAAGGCLTFVDRSRFTVRRIPILFEEGTLPTALPDGRAAFVSGDHLKVFDGKGELVGSTESGVGSFLGPTRVIALEGWSSWAIAAPTRFGFVFANHEGDRILQHSLVPAFLSSSGPTGFWALPDGSVAVANRVGGLAIFRVEEKSTETGVRQ